MEKASRSQFTLIAAGLAVGAVVAGAWWWGSARPVAAPAEASVPVVAVPASMPESAASAASAVAVADPASDAASAVAGLAENCGLGPVAGNASKARLQEAAQAAALKAQRDLVGQLRNSPDELARAVGLLLGNSDFIAPAPDPDHCSMPSVQSGGPGVIAACETELARQQRDVAQRRHAAAPDVQALAEQAQGTQSPAVYALALQACRRGGAAPAACGGLTTARWAELDPDNAAPWLALAAELNNDPAAQDQAVYRASQATHQDADLSWISQQVQQALPPEVQGQVRLQVEVAAVGVSMAQVYTGYQAAGRWCNEDAMADPARRGICNRLGNLMADNGRSMLDLALGTRLAERAGEAPDRLQALSARRASFTDALERMATRDWPVATADAASSAPPGQPRDRQCAATLRMSAYLGGVAREGELATIARLTPPGGAATR